MIASLGPNDNRTNLVFVYRAQTDPYLHPTGRYQRWCEHNLYDKFFLTCPFAMSRYIYRLPHSLYLATRPTSCFKHFQYISHTRNPTARLFSSTSATMTAKLSFQEAVLNRRSIYQITKKAPVPDARIKEIVDSVILNSPSSFNSQSTRIVVLVGADHDKFWDVITEVYKPILGAEQWERWAGRIAGFRAGYGTVCSFILCPRNLSLTPTVIGALLRRSSSRRGSATKEPGLCRQVSSLV